MTIVQRILAAAGFVLSLPFALAWVILATIRGRHHVDEDQIKPVDLDATDMPMNPATQPGPRLRRHNAGPEKDPRLAYLEDAEA